MRPSLDLLKDKKNLVGVEIGIGAGGNTKKNLENLNIKKLYLIDSWTKYPDYVEELKNTDNYALKTVTNGQKLAKNNLQTWNKKLVWINEKSSVAVNNIKDNELDFVYIDGNHNYEYVLEDITLYWPKLKNDGLMAGHDFLPRFQGVIKAVKEKFGDNYEIADARDRKPNMDWWTWKQI